MEYRNLIPYQQGAKSPRNNSASSTKATAFLMPKAQSTSKLKNQSLNVRGLQRSLNNHASIDRGVS